MAYEDSLIDVIEVQKLVTANDGGGGQTFTRWETVLRWPCRLETQPFGDHREFPQARPGHVVRVKIWGQNDIPMTEGRRTIVDLLGREPAARFRLRHEHYKTLIPIGFRVVHGGVNDSIGDIAWIDAEEHQERVGAMDRP